MHTSRTITHTVLLLLIAAAAWLGVILQFVTIIPDWLQQGKTWTNALVLFFSYFTILTNLMVAVVTSCVLVLPHSRVRRFCAKPSVVTAVTLYILVVGLVYNLELRPLNHPQGWARVADELVHSVVPILYVMYWFFFAVKGTLHWSNAMNWLIYPLLYLIYTFLHGYVTAYYPYPFLEVEKVGYDGFWISTFFMLLVFLFLSFLLIGIDKLVAKRNHRRVIPG